MRYTPREYQEEAIESIFAYFANHSGNPLVVAPTASGKSLMLAEFIRRAIERYPLTRGQPTRVVVLTHVKELIGQDWDAIRRQWPEGNVGVHSAGLKKRDTHSQVIVAGIQSCHRKAALLYCDLVIIDEAHLVPRNTSTMYGRFLKDLRSINPAVKVIGFTATDYRLDSGRLTEGKDRLFDEVCHEISIRRLVEEGYLSVLRSKATDTKLDVRGVKVRGGEFVAADLQAAVDVDSLNRAIVEEIIASSKGRESWIVFCSGVDHARHVAAILEEYEISTVTVFGETPSHERDLAIERFKRGEVRCMVNVSCLTTGFDAPQVDLLAMLRPTESTGLYVQICGRGMRIADGKDDCLVLDFAGNVERHGPVDCVHVKTKDQSDGEGEAPCKECDACRELVAVSCRVCPCCGVEFPPPELPETQLTTKASTAQIMSFGDPEVIEIETSEFSRHDKKGKPPSMRVDHWQRGGNIRHPVSEWVCVEHGGFAAEKAAQWWANNGGEFPSPRTVDEALRRTAELRRVVTVSTREDGKFVRIVRRELGDRPLPWETSTPRGVSGVDTMRPLKGDEEIPF